MNSSSTWNHQLNIKSKRWKPTIKTMMIKWKNSQNNSKQCLQQSQIRLTLWNTLQHISIHQSLWTLPMLSQISVGIHHWTVESLQKLVACGLWNMRSYDQYYMNSSSRHNSKETLIWALITSTTTSICVSMRWLEYDKTFFLVTSPSTDTMSLQNNACQIVLTLPILGMFRYTLPLDNHC